MLMAVGWLAILIGVALGVLGLTAFAQIAFGRDSPAVSAGPILLGLVIGPLVALLGITIIVSGFKLMGGHAWARTVLEIFSWIILCASLAWVVYSAAHVQQIHSYHLIQWFVFFLLSGAPSLIMLLLLHSGTVQRALTR